MNDQSLRRRLLREHLVDLVVLALSMVVISYFLALSVQSIIDNGTITLNAGSRWGLPQPVTLQLSQIPFAMVGVLLIIGGFAGLMASFLFRPAYHLVRLSVPDWQLSRVPSARFLRRVSNVQLTFIFLAGIGLLCVVWQYVAFQFNS